MGEAELFSGGCYDGAQPSSAGPRLTGIPPALVFVVVRNVLVTVSIVTNEFCAQPHLLTPPFFSEIFQ